MKLLLWLIGGISCLALVFLIFAKDREPSSGSMVGVKWEGSRDENRKSNLDLGLSKKDKLIAFIYASVCLYALGYLFYRSLLMAALLVPLALLYPRLKEKEYIAHQRKLLNLQFKDALHSIATSLTVGKSIETAFRDAPQELRLLYPEAEILILREIQIINNKVQMNINIEEAIRELAERTGLEDILYFAEVFAICNRTGGNLVEVIKNTSRIITEKNDFKQELELMLVQRRFEQRLLSFIPVVIILILSITSPEYMSPVYTTYTGRLVMSIALSLFGLAFYLSKKIIEIEV